MPYSSGLPPFIWGSQCSHQVELTYFTKEKARGYLKLGLSQFQVIFNLSAFAFVSVFCLPCFCFDETLQICDLIPSVMFLMFSVANMTRDSVLIN